jgi:hypothetical protein
VERDENAVTLGADGADLRAEVVGGALIRHQRLINLACGPATVPDLEAGDLNVVRVCVE